MGKKSTKGSVKAKCLLNVCPKQEKSLGNQSYAAGKCLPQNNVNCVLKHENAVGVKQTWGIDCAMLGDVDKCDTCKISSCQGEKCAANVCGSHPKGVNTKANFQVQQWLNRVKTDNESQKLQCLAEIVWWLKEGTVKHLQGFPIKSVVSALINLLEMNHKSDVMNFTFQALKGILEMFPGSSEVVVDAVPILLEEVQCGQDPDVLKQAFAILEMLSRTHGRAILQTGDLGGCLYYLEFLSIQVQRNVLAMVAKCCQDIQPSELHLIDKALPELSQRLNHPDKESTESILLCFLHLINNFRFNRVLLAKVLCPELVTYILQCDGKENKIVASLLPLVKVLTNSESESLVGSVPVLKRESAVASCEVGASTVPKAKEVKLAAGMQVPTKAVLKEAERSDQPEQLKYIEKLKMMYAELSKAFKEKESQLEQCQREGVILKEMHSVKVHDLESEIQLLKGSLASEIENNALESERNNRVVTELQKVVADLTRRLAKASNLHKETAEREQNCEQTCKELAQANAALHTHVVNLQRQCTELTDAKDLLAESEKNLQEQLRRDTAERATLKLMLDDLSMSHGVLEKRLCDTKAQKEDLESCIQVKARAMEQLRAQLKASQAESTFLRDQNFECKAERDSLQQRLCTLQDQVLHETQHQIPLLQQRECLQLKVEQKDVEIQLLKETFLQTKLKDAFQDQNGLLANEKSESGVTPEIKVVVSFTDQRQWSAVAQYPKLEETGVPNCKASHSEEPTKLSGDGSSKHEQKCLDVKLTAVKIPQSTTLRNFGTENPVYHVESLNNPMDSVDHCTGAVGQTRDALETSEGNLPFCDSKSKVVNNLRVEPSGEINIELSEANDPEGMTKSYGKNVDVHAKCTAKEQFRDCYGDVLWSKNFSPQVSDPVVLQQKSMVNVLPMMLLQGDFKFLWGSLSRKRVPLGQVSQAVGIPTMPLSLLSQNGSALMRSKKVFPPSSTLSKCVERSSKGQKTPTTVKSLEQESNGMDYCAHPYGLKQRGRICGRVTKTMWEKVYFPFKISKVGEVGTMMPVNRRRICSLFKGFGCQVLEAGVFWKEQVSQVLQSSSPAHRLALTFHRKAVLWKGI